MVGIVGIGFGLWWADSAAAALISLDILTDGAQNLRRAVPDLMDETPTTVDRDVADPLRDELLSMLRSLGWVEAARGDARRRLCDGVGAVDLAALGVDAHELPALGVRRPDGALGRRDPPGAARQLDPREDGERGARGRGRSSGVAVAAGAAAGED